MSTKHSTLGSAALMALFLAVVVMWHATPASAQVEEVCVLNPTTGQLECGLAGDDGEPPEFVWTRWYATGYCIVPSAQSILWERDLWRTEDWVVINTEFTCVEPDWGIIWDDVSQVASALGVPQFEMAPPTSFGAIVGSPMMLWYTGQSQIPPIAATVTDPTGVVYGVEGRAWIEQITWNMGDGSAVSSSYRDSFDDSVAFGSFDNPEAVYTYESTSSSLGYPVDPDRCDLAFTPVSVTLTWTGEYRLIEGLLQTAWNRVPANLDITETFEIPVREIRSSLNSDGYDPSDDECVWADSEG